MKINRMLATKKKFLIEQWLASFFYSLFPFVTRFLVIYLVISVFRQVATTKNQWLTNHIDWSGIWLIGAGLALVSLFQLGRAYLDRRLRKSYKNIEGLRNVEVVDKLRTQIFFISFIIYNVALLVVEPYVVISSAISLLVLFFISRLGLINNFIILQNIGFFFYLSTCFVLYTLYSLTRDTLSIFLIIVCGRILTLRYAGLLRKKMNQYDLVSE